MTRRLTATARRQQLVETAIEIAEATGVASIRLRDVASRADVSLGTLHHFFPSKAQLMTSAAESLTSQLVDAAIDEELLRTWDHFGTDGLEELISTVAAEVWKTVTQTAERQLVTYEMTTYALRSGEDSEVAGIARTQYERTTAAVYPLLDTLARVAQTEWLVPLEHIGAMVRSTFDGIVLRWLVDRDSVSATAQLDVLARMLAALAMDADTQDVEAEAGISAMAAD